MNYALYVALTSINRKVSYMFNHGLTLTTSGGEISLVELQIKHLVFTRRFVMDFILSDLSVNDYVKNCIKDTS